MSDGQMSDGQARIDPALVRHPSMVHAFRAALRERPNALALVCGERRLSYAELGRAVAGLSARLIELDVAGTCVALALTNSCEAVVAVLAAWTAGAQIAPINPFFTPPELEVVLREARPRLVISGPEARDKLQAL